MRNSDKITLGIKYISMAVIIGIIVGIVDTIFGRGLLAISDFRTTNYNYNTNNHCHWYVLNAKRNFIAVSHFFLLFSYRQRENASKHVDFLILLRRLSYSENLNSPSAQTVSLSLYAMLAKLQNSAYCLLVRKIFPREIAK